MIEAGRDARCHHERRHIDRHDCRDDDCPDRHRIHCQCNPISTFHSPRAARAQVSPNIIANIPNDMKTIRLLPLALSLVLATGTTFGAPLHVPGGPTPTPKPNFQSQQAKQATQATQATQAHQAQQSHQAHQGLNLPPFLNPTPAPRLTSQSPFRPLVGPNLNSLSQQEAVARARQIFAAQAAYKQHQAAAAATP